MEHSIRDYVSEGADISYEQLKSRFGEPKQIASTYVMEMEAEEIIDNIRCRKKIVNIILVIASIIALIYGVFIARVYASYERDANGYAVVEIIEVERKQIN